MYPAVNKWVHVAVVMTAGSTVNNVKMYYNGRVSVPTNTGANPALNTSSTLLKLFQKYRGWVSDFRYYDQALTQAQVMEVYGYKDLVLHYKFNEAVNATNAVDYSYYGWASTKGGTVTLGHTDGIRGQVAKFTGGTLNVTNFKGILGNNPRTLAFWFKQDAAFTYTGVMYYGAGTNQFQVQVNASGNIVVYNSYTNATTQSYMVGVGPYDFSTWRHIAVVTNGSDATQIKIYVDGVEVSSYDFANQQLNTINTQTSADMKAANNLTGYLSDLRFYAAEMSQSEVSNIMNNLTTKTTEPNYSSLRVYPTITNGFINFSKPFSNVKIYNIAGELVGEVNRSEINSINIEGYRSGVYILKADNQHIVRIIKQ